MPDPTSEEWLRGNYFECRRADDYMQTLLDVAVAARQVVNECEGADRIENDLIQGELNRAVEALDEAVESLKGEEPDA